MKYVPEIIKMLIVIGFAVGVIMMVGCAQTPLEQAVETCGQRKLPTQEALEECYLSEAATIEYEREVKKLDREEEMRTFVAGCKAAGGKICHNHKGAPTIRSRRNSDGIDYKWCNIVELRCARNANECLGW
jgi:hypothetical protein